MRLSAAVLPILLLTSSASAYSISAQSIGAGGFQDSTTQSQVEAGGSIIDDYGNQVDGHALTNGETGSLGGHMKVGIDNYLQAQSTLVTTFLIEKTWMSEIIETIESLQLAPGATELVIRVHVSGEDVSDLVPAPLVSFDNGYARSHAFASLRYYNLHSHTQGLDQILATGRADRNVPEDWVEVFGGDTSPPGYGSASGGAASATAELHIPASEVDGDDYLLVAGRLYGEVRGGHWNGAFAASELHGGMSFEIVGGDGVPQNPIFLSAPEPSATALGAVASFGIAAAARRRRR